MAELDTLEVDSLEEAIPWTNHQVIRVVTDKVISFINKGFSNLRDSFTIQEIREALLQLKGSMVDIA